MDFSAPVAEPSQLATCGSASQSIFSSRIGRNISAQAHHEGIVSLATASGEAEMRVQSHSVAAAVVGLYGTVSIG